MAGLKFLEDEYVIASNKFPYSPKKLREAMKEIDRKRRYMSRREMEKLMDNMPFNFKTDRFRLWVESVSQTIHKDLRYTCMMDPNQYLVDDPFNLAKAWVSNREGFWVFQFKNWDEMKPAMCLESENYKFDLETKEMMKKSTVLDNGGFLGNHPDYTHGRVAFAHSTFGRIGPKNAIFLDDHMW